MKKATKGAVALSAAGALLLGGAGTLAYWTDAETVTGGNISSGHLKLVSQPCSAWSLDDGVTPFDPATAKIVPGDTLTRTCDFGVDMVGTTLKASFGVTSPTVSGALDGKITSSATYLVAPAAGGSPVAAPGGTATIHGGDTIKSKISVAFPFGTAVDNDTMDVAGVLSDITVTATQVR